MEKEKKGNKGKRAYRDKQGRVKLEKERHQLKGEEKQGGKETRRKKAYRGRKKEREVDIIGKLIKEVGKVGA